ncbi:Protein kinase superfamily protein [Perilla frutescens var. frutescens]|nr:Protein kinase superfamily protein [Perilla frutescens var. frutescens]
MGYLSCKTESSIATSTPSTSPNQIHKNPIKIQEFTYKDLQLATNNFSHTKLLGRGSHGLVYKAALRGGRLVAVKKPSRTSGNPTEVDNEIDILSKLHSPRLVNLLGFTTDAAAHDRLLVVEFMSNGTLYDVLHTNSPPPNWGRRLKLALQTAKAVDTLHSLSPPVIHRDIKSANVLIDRNFNARLGDFGLALRCVDDCRLRSTPPAGTMGYLDPCYVTAENLSTKTDVFSFGILLLEIISGRKALDMANSPPSVVDWAIPLIRRGKLLQVYDPRILPPKDAMVRKMMAVVAAKCVRSCRERRPSMKEVVRCLSELSKLVPLNSWNGLANINPCMMVDDDVQSTSSVGVNLDDRFGTPLMRNPARRVQLELGVRSNLMELMSSSDGLETRLESDKKVSRLRVEIGRLVERTNARSLVVQHGKDR